MAKVYFNNDTLLPAIPTDLPSEYQYAFIRKNGTSGHFDLLFLQSKPYFKDGIYVENSTLTQKWYRIEIANHTQVSEWTFNKDTTGGFTIDDTRTVLWTNTDIPNGSVTATEIYKKASTPTQNGFVCLQETSATELTGSIDCRSGDILIASIVVRSELTIPSDMTLLATNETGELSQTLSFATRKVQETGTQSVTIKQASTGRIMLNLIPVAAKDVKYTGEFKKIVSGSSTAFSTTIENKTKKKLLWGLSCAYALTALGADNYYKITPTDMLEIHQDPTVYQIRNSNWLELDNTSQTHTIDYASNTSHKFLIDAVEIVYSVKKFLVRLADGLYTITDGALVKLEATTPTAAVFTEFGLDEAPASDILRTLTGFDVLLWHDSTEYQPKLTAEIKALKPPQKIISDLVDMSDSSILGISAVTITDNNTPLYAVSFDHKATWEYMVDGVWTTAASDTDGMTKDVLQTITPEQWGEKIGVGMYFKLILNDGTDAVEKVFIEYTN